MGNDKPPVEILTKPEWHSQPKESVKAFNAFTTYLDLGPQRTYERTARALGLGTDRHLKSWSKQWRWNDRVKAWIESQSEKRRHAAREELLRFVDQDRQLQQSILAVSARLLKLIDQRLQKVDDIPVEQLPSFVRAAATAAQKAEDTQMTILGVDDVLDFLDDIDVEEG
jgi:transposase-like protein